MESCIFCNIIAGEIPSYNVYEDGKTLAFIDIFGATDGHVVIIPKAHAEKLTLQRDDDVAALFDTVKKVATALEKAYGTEILSIGINHGEPAGVKHTHVHIMPRYRGDGGGIIQSLPGKKLKDKNFEEVAKKIVSFLGK